MVQFLLAIFQGLMINYVVRPTLRRALFCCLVFFYQRWLLSAVTKQIQTIIVPATLLCNSLASTGRFIYFFLSTLGNPGISPPSGCIQVPVLAGTLG